MTINIGRSITTLTHGPHSEVEASVSDPGAEQARALPASDVGHAITLLGVSRAPISAAVIAILLLGERLFPDGVFGPDLTDNVLSTYILKGGQTEIYTGN